MPIGQKPDLRGCQPNQLLGLIQDHKVVAQAMHFCEIDSHDTIIGGNETLSQHPP
jgi:hypothetical protein